MIYPSPKRDASERPEASFTPDFTQLDAANDRLRDALAHSFRQWNGKIPQSRDEFIATAVQHVVKALEAEEPDSFGAVLRGLIEIYATAERAEAVVRVIAEILDHDNPALTTECIAFASGLCSIQGGISITDIAGKYGISKQGVSKRVTECSHTLGLPPSRGMKDGEAQEVYRERAHRIHGTEADPTKAAGKRVRTVIAALGDIAQWHATRGDLSELDETQKLILKRAFASLEPINEAVALL